MTSSPRQQAETVVQEDNDVERCLACGGILLDDDLVYDDVGGGVLHARCCGPEREYYVNLETGETLAEGEPIPKPRVFRTEQMITCQRHGEEER
jgi:hypothetical protein